MALNKAALKSDIKSLLELMRTREENADEEFAEKLATAIDTYVKTAKIMYTAGLTAPNGPVTGVFNGSLQ